MDAWLHLCSVKNDSLRLFVLLCALSLRDTHPAFVRFFIVQRSFTIRVKLQQPLAGLI